MLEKLCIKIKRNYLEIVIYNSKIFYTLNNKQFFDDKKKYDFSDEILMIVNKTFSSLEIKKNIFLNYLYDGQWDKIFKKKFIENLGFEFQNLKQQLIFFYLFSYFI